MADPLPFPVGIGGFSAVDLRIVRSIVRTPFRSGEMQLAEVGPPRWRIACTTSFPLMTHRADGWMAWLDSLQGGMRLFLGGDPSRVRPIAHPNGIAGWNGSANVVSRLSAHSIALSGVPTSLQLNPGDMLELRRTVSGVLRVGLHRVTEAASADETSIDVKVEPAILDIFGGAAVASLTSPCALFMLDPDSVEGGKSTDFPPISFAAYQVL